MCRRNIFNLGYDAHCWWIEGPAAALVVLTRLFPLTHSECSLPRTMRSWYTSRWSASCETSCAQPSWTWTKATSWPCSRSVSGQEALILFVCVLLCLLLILQLLSTHVFNNVVHVSVWFCLTWTKETASHLFIRLDDVVALLLHNWQNS